MFLKARDDERAAASRAREKEGGLQATCAVASASVRCEVGRRVKFALEQAEELRQLLLQGGTVQNDMFLPRRTTFMFSMQAGAPDEAYSVLPILVTRSKGARTPLATMSRDSTCTRASQHAPHRLTFPPSPPQTTVPRSRLPSAPPSPPPPSLPSPRLYPTHHTPISCLITLTPRCCSPPPPS
jgi:hypothetical protein